MLQPRPFSYAHARPPEGKAFAADQLVSYHSMTRRTADTSDAKATISQLEGSLARQKIRAITTEDQIKIMRGEMDLPDHILAAGPIQSRVADVAAIIAHLKGIVNLADAHNEALAAGLNQLGPKTLKS